MVSKITDAKWIGRNKEEFFLMFKAVQGLSTLLEICHEPQHAGAKKQKRVEFFKHMDQSLVEMRNRFHLSRDLPLHASYILVQRLRRRCENGFVVVGLFNNIPS